MTNCTAVEPEVSTSVMPKPTIGHNPASLHPENGGNKVLRNVGILPQHCTASHPRRPRLKSRSNSIHTTSFCISLQIRSICPANRKTFIKISSL